MSLGQHVRVTMRFHLENFHKEADIALPATSTLDELLFDIADFMDVPITDEPLRATTPAGRPIPRDVSLAETQLADGSIVLIQPTEELPAPVIRDAAEALAQSHRAGSARGLIQLWVLVGLVCVGIACPLPWYYSVAVATGVGVVWQLLHCSLWLSPVVVAAAGIAGAAFGIGAAALAILAATTLLVVLRRIHTAVAAAGVTLAAGLGLCALHPAAAIAGIVLLLAAAPGLSMTLAGIRVPFVPTAGQGLEAADDIDRDVDRKSIRAHHMYMGMCIGVALAGAIACVIMMPAPSWVLVALSAAAGLAVVVHAGRHAQAVAIWALMALAAACVLAAVWMSTQLTSVPAGIVAGLIALSTPWWAGNAARLSPTIVQWFERVEVIAIVVVLPLAAYASGLFAFIRGLG